MQPKSGSLRDECTRNWQVTRLVVHCWWRYGGQDPFRQVSSPAPVTWHSSQISTAHLHPRCDLFESNHLIGWGLSVRPRSYKYNKHYRMRSVNGLCIATVFQSANFAIVKLWPVTCSAWPREFGQEPQWPDFQSHSQLVLNYPPYQTRPSGVQSVTWTSRSTGTHPQTICINPHLSEVWFNLVGSYESCNNQIPGNASNQCSATRGARPDSLAFDWGPVHLDQSARDALDTSHRPFPSIPTNCTWPNSLELNWCPVLADQPGCLGHQ